MATTRRSKTVSSVEDGPQSAASELGDRLESDLRWLLTDPQVPDQVKQVLQEVLDQELTELEVDRQ